jgi:MarR family transcriptional regulator, lower aerobic nicotinate degradation pathway regulator
VRPSEETGHEVQGSGRPPRSLTRRVGFLLSALGRLSRDATEQALESLGIRPHHYGVLVVLDEGGPAPQRIVGEALGIDKSTMVVVVDHLEERGLVERHRNPENRRAYRLTLTGAGRKLLLEADPLVRRVEEDVMAPLDDAQRRQLHGLLLSLLSGFSEQDG